MRESFEPADTYFNPVSEEELRALLFRLHGDPEPVEREIPESQVTIDAICEATGLSVLEVERALQEVRTEDREAELARRIRELEEPTFRVERPGHAAPDPLRQRPLVRGKLFSNLLDELPKVGELPKRKRKQELTGKEKFAGVISSIVLFAFAVVTVALCAWAIYSAVRPR